MMRRTKVSGFVVFNDRELCMVVEARTLRKAVQVASETFNMDEKAVQDQFTFIQTSISKKILVMS